MDTARERAFSSSGNGSDKRRFRIKHALRALEDALLLLDPSPADGIEVRALERVRDDLAVVLRVAAGERS